MRIYLRGPYAENRATLAAAPKEHLEAALLNEHYNSFLSSQADYGEKDTDPHGHGKRVPYIGWFWRYVEFSDHRIPIGDCGQFIGFMENNKWGYPQRYLTAEEHERVMGIIDAAMHENSKGGVLSEIIANTEAKVSELWDYMQTLSIPALTGEPRG